MSHPPKPFPKPRPQLSPTVQREIWKELANREAALSSRKVASKPTEADQAKAKSLLKAMFSQQREFFFEAGQAGQRKGRFRVARCTRRAGKTTGAAIKLLVTLLLDPRSVSLYLAKSTTLVRDQIWPELKTLVAEYDLPFEFHETQMRMQHARSTGRAIFRGANDTAQLDKLRGLGVGGTFVLAIFDESGTFGAEMEKLVSSIVSPGLRDRLGELLLIGTPGYFPDGLFYAASEGLPGYEGWVRRTWSLTDNPYLSADAKDLRDIRREFGLTEDDPVYIREWLGQYCLNTRIQMFEYDPARNGYRGSVPLGLTYYLGVDFGWTDETAIVALGWNPTMSKMWAVESWAAPGQTSDDVAAKILEVKAKYRPTRIVGDTGGYGKGVVEQIWRDYGIYIEQAQKLEKLNHVEFMNSAFRRQDLYITLDDADPDPTKSLTYELPRVLWAENKKDAHNKAKDNRAHALLYAWRAASNIAGKTAVPGKQFTDAQLVDWPEEELIAKLGLANTAETNLAWFLKDL